MLRRSVHLYTIRAYYTSHAEFFRYNHHRLHRQPRWSIIADNTSSSFSASIVEHHFIDHGTSGITPDSERESSPPEVHATRHQAAVRPFAYRFPARAPAPLQQHPATSGLTSSTSPLHSRTSRIQIKASQEPCKLPRSYTIVLLRL
jgi:hypothetical protein